MTRAVVAAIAILTALAGCKDKNEGYSAEDYALVAEAEKQTAATLPPPPEDVMPQSNAEYLGLFEAKGVHLGMFKEDVAAALPLKGFFIPPEGGAPMTEMVAQLPPNSSADTAYLDTPTCVAEFERHRNFTRDEANSMSNLGYRGCDLTMRVFYDDSGMVNAFYVTPAGFGLGRIDVRQLAEAVVDNLPVAELVPEQRPIRTLGQQGLCTNFVGRAAAGERIVVSDCGFLRMQVQQSASAAGDFH